MHYKKVEEYSFRTPNEYMAYLAFKERLTEMGVVFADQQGRISCDITILTRGDFEVDDTHDVLSLVEEDK